MELKSATGRTVMAVSVSDKGDVDIKVVRNERTVHTFNLPREPGIGGNDEIVVRGNVVQIIDRGGIEPFVKETIQLEGTFDTGTTVVVTA